MTLLDYTLARARCDDNIYHFSLEKDLGIFEEDKTQEKEEDGTPKIDFNLPVLGMDETIKKESLGKIHRQIYRR